MSELNRDSGARTLTSEQLDRLFHSPALRRLFQENASDEYALIWLLSKHTKDSGSEKIYLKDMVKELNLPLPKVTAIARSLQGKGLVRWTHDGNGEDGTYILLHRHRPHLCPSPPADPAEVPPAGGVRLWGGAVPPPAQRDRPAGGNPTAGSRESGGRTMSRRNVETYANDQQALCRQNDFIPDSLFREYGVNRGLRDVNGVGVLTGLTNISKIVSFQNVDGQRVPCEGQLFYRGYNIKNLIGGLGPEEFGFEKIAYLLLFGDLPSPEQLAEFTGILSDCRTLPTNFTRDVIMKAPSRDIMNSMTRSVLTLASYDDKVNGDLGNSIRQCIRLISEFPMLAVYGYHAYNHYENDDSMYIHRPDPNLSTAENILRMLRHDKSYTQLEAKALDIALLLHMEHGGGNNSTFTTRVVTSSGSDTYSTMAAALCSLKGPRHGGANIKVIEMIQDIKSHLHDWTDPDETSAYLRKLLNKEAFDHSGLIYGMGHAVYSISDPREQILRSFVNQLAVEKGRQDDLALYRNIEEEAPKLISKNRPIYKGVSANIDLYSGFLYDLLGIPVELYTPLFAIARIVGWSAHRIEELVCMNKIIRPAYMSVMRERG